jgi:hypothetical protein
LGAAAAAAAAVVVVAVVVVVLVAAVVLYIQICTLLNYRLFYIKETVFPVTLFLEVQTSQYLIIS